MYHWEKRAPIKNKQELIEMYPECFNGKVEAMESTRKAGIKLNDEKCVIKTRNASSRQKSVISSACFTHQMA